MFQQIVAPDVTVPAREGMCLEYVRKAYGRPVVSPRAIDAWNGSNSRHADWNFPAGCAVPVFFSLDGIPAGHVAIRMADGSVYSTSDLDPSPIHHHSSMKDLMDYYAYYNKPLTYLGWTEDMDGAPVVGLIVQVQSTFSKGSFLDNLTPEQQQNLYKMTSELYRDYSQGILGKQRDGDSFNFLRSIGAKLGVTVNETSRQKKYGK